MYHARKQIRGCDMHYCDQWMEVSNDVHFAVGWILTQNHEKPWIIALDCDFWQKIWPTLKSTLGHRLKGLFMLITMVQFPASYLIHIPRYDVSFIWIHGVYIIWAMYVYYARYLRLGMRYWGGICTIVISMNGAFKWCPFCFKLNFGPKLWKTMDYI